MKFAWRRTNNLQNVGYGRLLFESRSQFALTRLFGLEKPSVLDGDDGLVGEGLQRLDLRVRRGSLRKTAITPIAWRSRSSGAQRALRTRAWRKNSGVGPGPRSTSGRCARARFRITQALACHGEAVMGRAGRRIRAPRVPHCGRRPAESVCRRTFTNERPHPLAQLRRALGDCN